MFYNGVNQLAIHARRNDLKKFQKFLAKAEEPKDLELSTRDFSWRSLSKTTFNNDNSYQFYRSCTLLKVIALCPLLIRDVSETSEVYKQILTSYLERAQELDALQFQPADLQYFLAHSDPSALNILLSIIPDQVQTCTEALSVQNYRTFYADTNIGARSYRNLRFLAEELAGLDDLPFQSLKTILADSTSYRDHTTELLRVMLQVDSISCFTDLAEASGNTAEFFQRYIELLESTLSRSRDPRSERQLAKHLEILDTYLIKNSPEYLTTFSATASSALHDFIERCLSTKILELDSTLVQTTVDCTTLDTQHPLARRLQFQHLQSRGLTTLTNLEKAEMMLRAVSMRDFKTLENIVATNPDYLLQPNLSSVESKAYHDQPSALSLAAYNLDIEILQLFDLPAEMYTDNHPSKLARLILDRATNPFVPDSYSRTQELDEETCKAGYAALDFLISKMPDLETDYEFQSFFRDTIGNLFRAAGTLDPAYYDAFLDKLKTTQLRIGGTSDMLNDAIDYAYQRYGASFSNNEQKYDALKKLFDRGFYPRTLSSALPSAITKILTDSIIENKCFTSYAKTLFTSLSERQAEALQSFLVHDSFILELFKTPELLEAPVTTWSGSSKLFLEIIPAISRSRDSKLDVPEILRLLKEAKVNLALETSSGYNLMHQLVLADGTPSDLQAALDASGVSADAQTRSLCTPAALAIESQNFNAAVFLYDKSTKTIDADKRIFKALLALSNKASLSDETRVFFTAFEAADPLIAELLTDYTIRKFGTEHSMHTYAEDVKYLEACAHFAGKKFAEFSGETVIESDVFSEALSTRAYSFLTGALETNNEFLSLFTSSSVSRILAALVSTEFVLTAVFIADNYELLNFSPTQLPDIEELKQFHRRLQETAESRQTAFGDNENSKRILAKTLQFTEALLHSKEYNVSVAEMQKFSESTAPRNLGLSASRI